MIRVCPKCRGIAHYNPHFNAFMCLNPECTWMEERKKELHREVRKIKLSRKLKQVARV
jgi:hypothetical protein